MDDSRRTASGSAREARCVGADARAQVAKARWSRRRPHDGRRRHAARLRRRSHRVPSRASPAPPPLPPQRQPADVAVARRRAGCARRLRRGASRRAARCAGREGGGHRGLRRARAHCRARSRLGARRARGVGARERARSGRQLVRERGERRRSALRSRALRGIDRAMGSAGDRAYSRRIRCAKGSRPTSRISSRAVRGARARSSISRSPPRWSRARGRCSRSATFSCSRACARGEATRPGYQFWMSCASFRADGVDGEASPSPPHPSDVLLSISPAHPAFTRCARRHDRRAARDRRLGASTSASRTARRSRGCAPG